jgi:hypothetical protein
MTQKDGVSLSLKILIGITSLRKICRCILKGNLLIVNIIFSFIHWLSIPKGLDEVVKLNEFNQSSVTSIQDIIT